MLKVLLYSFGSRAFAQYSHHGGPRSSFGVFIQIMVAVISVSSVDEQFYHLDGIVPGGICHVLIGNQRDAAPEPGTVYLMLIKKLHQPSPLAPFGEIVAIQRVCFAARLCDMAEAIADESPPPLNCSTARDLI